MCFLGVTISDMHISPLWKKSHVQNPKTLFTVNNKSNLYEAVLGNRHERSNGLTVGREMVGKSVLLDYCNSCSILFFSEIVTVVFVISLYLLPFSGLSDTM
jgi:hypothetical protein